MTQKFSLSYSQSGKGFPVVFLHGFCENKEIWKSFPEKLSSAFTTIVPDMPGFGESTGNKNFGSIDSIAEQIYLLLQELKIAECILVAHSLGGYVALGLAEKYKNLIKGLCLFHSSAYPDSEEKKHTRNKTADFIDKNGVTPFAENFVPPLFYKGRKDELADAIEKVRQIVISTPKETTVAVTKAMRDRPDRTKVLQEATYPILFIAGKEDEAIPLQANKEQFFMPKHSIVHILAETAHMGMFERPEETYLAVEQFCHFCVKIGNTPTER
jgi:pimeloyl-ACP methyl ester carboxylesterase